MTWVIIDCLEFVNVLTLFALFHQPLTAGAFAHHRHSQCTCMRTHPFCCCPSQSLLALLIQVRQVPAQHQHICIPTYYSQQCMHIASYTHMTHCRWSQRTHAAGMFQAATMSGDSIVSPEEHALKTPPDRSGNRSCWDCFCTTSAPSYTHSRSQCRANHPNTGTLESLVCHQLFAQPYLHPQAPSSGRSPVPCIYRDTPSVWPCSRCAHCHANQHNEH